MRREWWLACSSSSRLMSFSSSSLPFLLEEVVVKSVKCKRKNSRKKIQNIQKKEGKNFLRFTRHKRKRSRASERASERESAQCSASNITRRRRRRS